MNYLSQISKLNFPLESIQKSNIQLQIDFDAYLPEIVVNKLASIDGPVDIYCWYEGTQCLPKVGANFMTRSIFEPLYELKKDTKTYLYSLKGWDFCKIVANMPSFTPLGQAINRINTKAIECIYASAFFQYCVDIKEKQGLYDFLSEELPKKAWLSQISENKKDRGKTVATLFNERSSLFDCIRESDVSKAYSSMQYVEGYYLIQESVRKALLLGQKKIQIAFVLPNDESKYYIDYPKDIERMLRIDFGKDVSDVDINIFFQFFEYGKSSNDRPYINVKSEGNNPNSKSSKVRVNEISSYFDYLYPKT